MTRIPIIKDSFSSRHGLVIYLIQLPVSFQVSAIGGEQTFIGSYIAYHGLKPLMKHYNIVSDFVWKKSDLVQITLENGRKNFRSHY